MFSSGCINNNKLVLCVDDDQDTCELLETFLTDYKITTVGNGAEALALARSRPFHLYVFDIWLTDMSGIELCRQIRTFDANTPVIFASAAAYDKDRREALAAGGQAYIVKPLDFSELERTIKQLILKADLQSLEAKTAEIAAMRDQIQDRLERVEATFNMARKAAFKHKARQVYLGAGGTLANFEYLWDEILNTESLNY
jgi:DNA-binding response OmpR family regulator